MRGLLTIIMVLTCMLGMSQTQPTLPTGSVLFSNNLFQSPDGLIWTGKSGSYINIGSKADYDALIKAGYTKAQVDSIATAVRQRSTHTGTQAISTVSGLQSKLNSYVRNDTINVWTGAPSAINNGLRLNYNGGNYSQGIYMVTGQNSFFSGAEQQLTESRGFTVHTNTINGIRASVTPTGASVPATSYQIYDAGLRGKNGASSDWQLRFDNGQSLLRGPNTGATMRILPVSVNGKFATTGEGNIPLTIADIPSLQTALDAKENTITAGTISQYWRGDKTWQTLNSAAVGLGNVDNTSDLNKPISTATQSALDAKQNVIELNLMDFGAVGDGIVDDTEAMRAFMRAADSLKVRNLYMPSGKYRITKQINLPLNSNIRGDGIGKTILDFKTALMDSANFANNFPNIFAIGAVGSVDSIAKVTTAIYAGRTIETELPVVGKLDTGDIIILQNSKNYSHNTARSSYREGEFLKVVSAPESPGRIVTESYILGRNYTSDSTYVFKLNKNSISLSDFSIQASPAVRRSLTLIQLSALVDPRVSNVESIGGSNAAIRIGLCFNTVIDQCNLNKSSPDDGSQLSYGITIGNSQNVSISNSFAFGTRHGITTGGGGRTSPYVWLSPVNRFVVIKNSTIGNATNNLDAMDFHENTEYSTVDNNYITGSANIRGHDNYFLNNKVFKTGGGNNPVFKINRPKSLQHTILNNEFYLTSTANGRLMMAITTDSYLALSGNLTISGNKFQGTTAGGNVTPMGINIASTTSDIPKSVIEFTNNTVQLQRGNSTTYNFEIRDVNARRGNKLIFRDNNLSGVSLVARGFSNQIIQGNTIDSISDRGVWIGNSGKTVFTGNSIRNTTSTSGAFRYQMLADASDSLFMNDNIFQITGTVNRRLWFRDIKNLQEGSYYSDIKRDSVFNVTNYRTYDYNGVEMNYNKVASLTSPNNTTYPTTQAVTEWASGRLLPLSGGTLSGSLNGTTASFSGNVTASTAPTNNNHLVNKAYVDSVANISPEVDLQSVLENGSIATDIGLNNNVIIQSANSNWAKGAIYLDGDGVNIQGQVGGIRLQSGAKPVRLIGNIVINDGSEDKYNLPNYAGLDGQVLTTNGEGATSWQTPSSETWSIVDGWTKIETKHEIKYRRKGTAYGQGVDMGESQTYNTGISLPTGVTFDDLSWFQTSTIEKSDPALVSRVNINPLNQIVIDYSQTRLSVGTIIGDTVWSVELIIEKVEPQ